MSLFPFVKPPLRSPSPAWSVYDDQWGSSEAPQRMDLANEQSTGVTNTRAPSHFAYISYPPAASTLKGGNLKKKAPIRRGAQGAVYSAYDTSLTGESTALPCSHVDPASAEDLSGVSSQSVAAARHDELQRGKLVAVKRIFIQSNDFGARDISATVLREITLHRFVCAQQRKAVAAAVVESRTPQPSNACCLVDESARVLQLHRIVEAPHKEMCLVLELAATNLERLLAPPVGYGGGVSGGHRKKPGTVTLFNGLGGALNLQEEEGEGGVKRQPTPAQLAGQMNLSRPPTNATTAGTRCPLLSQLPLVRFVMRRLLRLVCFLHEECGVVHRDLKPSNVLVEEGGGLRLGDFGSARFIPPAGSAEAAAVSHVSKASEALLPLRNPQSTAGPSASAESLSCTPPSMRTTLHYRPPEVLFGDQSCRPAGDVWALGVVFAQLLLQKNLFHAESELDLLGAIQKLLGMPTKTPPWIQASSTDDTRANAENASLESVKTGESQGPSTRPPFAVATGVQASLPHKLHAGIVPADGLNLVTRMLHQLPEYRITIREALAHPFLNVRNDADGRIDEEATALDDRAGAALWKQKVDQVLQSSRLAESATAAASPGGLGGLGLKRPLFAGLLGYGDEDEDEDMENEGGEEGDFLGEGGASPFRLNLGGGGFLSS